jgi:HNH endonuclease
MPKLQRLRAQAFDAQKGRCTYCGLPMWLKSPSELQPFGIRQRTAAPLRCTTEHLVARLDGGRDVKDNVAAACWLCNVRRHKRKKPPSPEAYRVLVQRRVDKGKWHPPAVTKLCGKCP